MDESIIELSTSQASGLPSDFFQVAQMLPGDQEVVSVGLRASVAEALSLMRENDYSQLPVVLGNRVFGVFSYRSLAAGLASGAIDGNPLESPVSDLLADLAFVRLRDDLHDLLPFLQRDDAVLVGDEDRLMGVIMTADVTTFLWEVTEPFVLVRDIELAVRKLMTSACASREHLEGCIRNSARPRKGGVFPTLLEELSLGELVKVLVHEQNYARHFRSAFGGNSRYVEGQLEPIVRIRNEIFHFVDRLGSSDRQTLLSARRWIQRKADVMEAAA
ncbi:CBS domain protein [Kineococcus xinjiangensis]|uniref:CBS domain protein n=1 Tax=Kineococcus xinjiangensis TaxID=512762 RepID=A0A2S6IE88_9ACTN|nr:CBS domain-containing protein [Kineococcus xinjiangensis]PPK92507.1 CBS domain protein [Kineococcus xinjiangensis]